MVFSRAFLVSLGCWMLLGSAYTQDVPEIGYFNLSTGEGKVYLSWQLKAGATCFGITVHRSADGQFFDPIGGIEGVCGDLSKPESYNFVDEDPPVNQRVFYRLELGLGNFTEIRYVDVVDLGDESYQVRPNPVATNARIIFANPQKEESTLHVLNLQGQTIYRQSTRLDHFDIHARDLSAGLYMFSISQDGSVKTMTGKFLVISQ